MCIKPWEFWVYYDTIIVVYNNFKFLGSKAKATKRMLSERVKFAPSHLVESASEIETDTDIMEVQSTSTRKSTAVS